MKYFTKLNAEKSNIWSFGSFLAEVAASVYILRAAYYQDTMAFKVVLAIVGAVLAINILAKLYTLIRK